MSIVHEDKIWVEIAKSFEMRTSGGGGGGGVISDFGHPRTRGEGGSKKGKFLRTSFMDGPLQHLMNLPTKSISNSLKRCQFSSFTFSAISDAFVTRNLEVRTVNKSKFKLTIVRACTGI